MILVLGNNGWFVLWIDKWQNNFIGGPKRVDSDGLSWSPLTSFDNVYILLYFGILVYYGLLKVYCTWINASKIWPFHLWNSHPFDHPKIFRDIDRRHIHSTYTMQLVQLFMIGKGSQSLRRKSMSTCRQLLNFELQANRSRRSGRTASKAIQWRPAGMPGNGLNSWVENDFPAEFLWTYLPSIGWNPLTPCSLACSVSIFVRIHSKGAVCKQPTLNYRSCAHQAWPPLVLRWWNEQWGAWIFWVFSSTCYLLHRPQIPLAPKAKHRSLNLAGRPNGDPLGQSLVMLILVSEWSQEWKKLGVIVIF